MPIHTAADETRADLIVLRLSDPVTVAEMQAGIEQVNTMIVARQGQHVVSVLVDGSAAVVFDSDINLMPLLAKAFADFQGRFVVLVPRTTLANAALAMLLRRLGRRSRNFAVASTLEDAYHKLQLFIERDSAHDNYF